MQKLLFVAPSILLVRLVGQTSKSLKMKFARTGTPPFIRGFHVLEVRYFRSQSNPNPSGSNANETIVAHALQY